MWMDAERKQMKEDIIKLFLSIHSSSCSPPDSSSSKLITTTTSSPRTEKLKIMIEDHLPSMFTANLITPTHPPYAVMILEAIRNLKGKGKDTNKKSISDYINKYFEGLPWAASQFLNHYLKELVDSGDISFISTNSSYHLTEQEEDSQNPSPSSTCDKKEFSTKQQKKKPLRRRKKKGRLKERHCSAMVLVSQSTDEEVVRLGGNSETMNVIDVEPLQKQMPETNFINESVEEEHHGTVSKTLLVYQRRRKSKTISSSSEKDENMTESSTTATVGAANDTDRNTHHTDRLMMTVRTSNDTHRKADQNDGIMIIHTPKRRNSGKEKWMKFQQTHPQREFRPRPVPILPGSSSKNRSRT